MRFGISKAASMHSALYIGRLRHRRFAPRGHVFSYRLFMMYVDLAELDTVFQGRWLWSAKRPALAWLRRADYLGDAALPLEEAVRDRVQSETGSRPGGPIRMLTHLRYFGIAFNPVTFYYCFDPAGTRVETIVAEITNTPWNQRHAYVLSCSGSCSQGISVAAKQGGNGKEHHRFMFRKTFHVSPFMSMQQNYDWRFSTPGERLAVHMQNMQGERKVFDATLDLERHEIRGASMAHALAAFPLMTVKVIGGIYWQAIKLWCKRIPFHNHPDKGADHEHGGTSPVSR